MGWFSFRGMSWKSILRFFSRCGMIRWKQPVVSSGFCYRLYSPVVTICQERFGRKIEMKAPETLKDMLSIFNIHTKGKPLDEALNTEYFAKRLLDAKATGADVAYIVNKANENSLERSGIYAKMAKGTFVPSDMDGVKLLNADFEKAVDDFIAESKPQNRKPIGFVHYPQSNKGKSSIMA